MTVIVAAVYVGRPARLQDGRVSAMVKAAVQGPVMLGPEGLSGDQVADRRVHGGPEQALHHYPAERYAQWAAQFPEIAAQLLPGTLGENISTTGMTEDNVHIGDIYRWGEAEIQLSQPRQPCMKINSRYGVEGLSEAVMAAGQAGWYYRVRRAGKVAAGQAFERIERLQGSVSLAELWSVHHAHRPPLEALVRIADAPALAEKWRSKFRQRLEYLQRISG